MGVSTLLGLAMTEGFPLFLSCSPSSVFKLQLLELHDGSDRKALVEEERLPMHGGVLSRKSVSTAQQALQPQTLRCLLMVKAGQGGC